MGEEMGALDRPQRRLLALLDGVPGRDGDLCFDCANNILHVDRDRLLTARAELRARGMIDVSDGRMRLTAAAEPVLRGDRVGHARP